MAITCRIDWPGYPPFGGQSVASGGFADVGTGFLNDSRVRISKLRVFSKDDRQRLIKVCCRYPFRFPSLTKSTVLLQGSGLVEKHTTPKSPRHHRCVCRNPFHDIRVDAEWEYHGIYKEEPGHQPTPSCMFPSCCTGFHVYPLVSCLVVRKASITCMVLTWFMGKSRGQANFGSAFPTYSPMLLGKHFDR
jgi:hypothetical protein